MQKNHEHGIVLPNPHVGLDNQGSILTLDLWDRCFLDVTCDDFLVVLVELMWTLVFVDLVYN